MEKDKIKIITPILCRTARTLLDWKQEELSKKAEVALGTIGFFERGLTIPHSSTLKIIKQTFVEAGIEFENNDEFVGLRLKKVKPLK